MDFLTEIVQSSELPLIVAFVLGLLTAVSPCPLATNITATAFITRSFQDKKAVLWSGIFYTLGRAFSYTLIGAVIFLGASKFQVAKFFQGNGEKYLAPLLILIGLVMLDVIKLNFLGKIDLTHRLSEKFQNKGFWGAFMLGALFALAFCPYSGALYFGMLLPLTVSSVKGLYLPFVFAVGTGLPVLLFTYLMAFAMGKVSKIFNLIQQTERVLRQVAGAVFILTGVYYTLIFLEWI
ncbi:aromatic aminobenezylarsenical efflux permease ArsG family transporter [Hugenholtzia roseola]|uniref:aromatic aminobenezylarsenical efflux permease ArsG family transporter n=1 Tax=Hugenholtzia roseola TaxID=1002 RepID=UPI000417C410|nr:aromatic aminobenezylarsenical efflux permease ArsG family transporter [Hugenholtzia roseola]